MRPFEYARPQTESEALDLLGDHDADTAVLAGGTDLIRLLQQELVNPRRVVDVGRIESMQGIERTPEGGVKIGALATLDDLRESSLLADYPSMAQVVDEVRAIQIQAMGTLGGDLCHLPNCWYFRNGYGLLAQKDGKSLVEGGDNRYHAVFGNAGPAKYVSASRFAPGLIAWNASIRIVGPEPDAEELMPLEYFYSTPKTARQGVHQLRPGQMISHVILPPARGRRSASYEVLQIEGLDWPLAAAACCLDVRGGIVEDARIVLGHVAPIPWISHEAARAVLGRAITPETAEAAGAAAVATATPLSGNGYKVTIAQTCVERALLRAAGLPEGGL